jgi:beta-glucanase (GH16 family)
MSGGGPWILQDHLSDEFNGTAVDATKWKTDISSWGMWSWRRENVTVADGLLHITARYGEHPRAGQRMFYTSGILQSRSASIRFGYFEARIRAAQRDSGVTPAFWAYRSTRDEWTEIDFVELTQQRSSPYLADFNTHVFRHPKRAGAKPLRESRTRRMNWHPSADFHVYGCEWTEKRISWYVDGHLVATRANDFWYQGLLVTLSMGFREPLLTSPTPDGFPTTMLVDYVRTWKLSPNPGNRRSGSEERLGN